MPQKDVYSKKITSEEEQKNFVLVLKDRLAFFPEEGETFKLIHNGQPRKAKIESYPCSCRGPDQPHSHYFVKSKGLRAGQNHDPARCEGRGPLLLASSASPS
ncbi:hypothetical protein E6H11_04675 [Candidatus Bathyarchaeota archaeon]|nr:MAG: hypothetical protein E6H11_04675 [Candidatus Bathyarchaeota archaeon]